MASLEMNERIRPKLAGAQILFCTNHYNFTHVQGSSTPRQQGLAG